MHRSLSLRFDQLDTARNPFHTAITRGCDTHKLAGSHLYESCILSLFVKRNSQSRLLGLLTLVLVIRSLKSTLQTHKSVILEPIVDQCVACPSRLSNHRRPALYIGALTNGDHQASRARYLLKCPCVIYRLYLDFNRRWPSQIDLKCLQRVRPRLTEDRL
jgi:hypothetical protein